MDTENLTNDPRFTPGLNSPRVSLTALGEADLYMEKKLEYEDFLRSKMVHTPRFGFHVDLSEITTNFLDGTTIKPHARDIIQWACAGGRRAIFAAFGLTKTVMQLEIGRLVCKHTGGRFLIGAPLGVRQQFFEDARLKLGLPIKFIRRTEEAGPTGIYITNYESIRDGKIDPMAFDGASLDEASILRGMCSGTKTYRECLHRFAGMKYKFVATATPSPNEFIELLAYSSFLEVGDVGQIKTRFFKRDAVKADHLTLHEHKKIEFLLWCCTWAIFITKPSDLGYDDTGYDLPGLEIHWHEIPTDETDAGEEVSGQRRLVKHQAIGVVEAAREKRDSVSARIAMMMELRDLDPSAHRVIWHDLEDERRAIERAIPGIATVHGKGGSEKQLQERERKILEFSNGTIAELATKPSLAGSGNNFQQHCAWAIFLGIGFKFNDFLQAIHRILRFLQTKRVRLDLIYTSAELEVRRELERKWQQHNELMAEMSRLIKEYGLAQASIEALKRSLGTERIEVRGEGWRLVNDDCVIETRRMAADSVHLVLSSIPFSAQYEYSPSYNDFGHNESNPRFFEQLDFLTPELLRILKPGRLCAIHVKDRIVPGGINGLGFQTVYPFHLHTVHHFMKHGFAYMGMKTIVTDVVRENNQTYRLGWSEQCKDGSKMGVGMPEYLLIFRKPPSDTSNSYADEPVLKSKPNCVTETGQIVPFERNLPIKAGTGYSRSRWQIDAHGFTRSSGDRILQPEDLANIPHERIFKLFREYSRNEVYNFEHHVKLGESLESQMRLPVTFMLLQPQSWSNEVWTDITRMLTLNTLQYSKGRELHLCPMQWDLVDRAIDQWTMPNEKVYDPFSGLGTVPYRAVLKGRRGEGCELNARYHIDAVHYLKAAELKVGMPGLFDALEAEDVPA